MLSQLKSVVRKGLRRYGVEVDHYSKTIRARRAQILKGQGISLVLDVGANMGQYALELRESGYSGRIVSFEPLDAAFTSLSKEAARDENWECRQLALGDTVKPVELHVAQNTVSSSLLPMHDRHLASAPHSAYTGTQTVMMTTLEALVPDLVKSEDRIYLKLDVQGYEMQALKGVGAFLNTIRMLEVELSLVPLYEGQPLIHEMLSYLYRQAFELVALEDSFVDRRSGHVLQANGIFVRCEGDARAL